MPPGLSTRTTISPSIREPADQPRYRWSHPTEWLEEKILTGHDAREYAVSLLRMVDGDQIQDEFQSQMHEDGYFSQEGA